MIVKMSKPESLLLCYRWKPTKEFLKACKKACTEIDSLWRLIETLIFLQFKLQGGGGGGGGRSPGN